MRAYRQAGNAPSYRALGRKAPLDIELKFRFFVDGYQRPSRRNFYGGTSCDWDRQERRRKVEQDFGSLTSDTNSQVRGMIDQAQGTAEKFYGQAKDAASDAAEGVRKTAVSFEDTLHHTIQNKPYTAVAIALGLGLGIGWLFGRAAN